jgi:hypothetical protein
VYRSTHLTTTTSLLSSIHPASHSMTVYDETINGYN